MSDDDRFNYPERWQVDGRQVLWIADSSVGDTPIHYAFLLRDKVFHSYAKRDYFGFTYTEPDPWDGVELPEVTLGGVVTQAVYPYLPALPPGLPPRKFKLVPL